MRDEKNLVLLYDGILDNGGAMKIGKQNVTVFKIKNRKGFAAICANNLTEGMTVSQALARMTKAVKRTQRKKR